jgi:hypothetical protein
LRSYRISTVPSSFRISRATNEYQASPVAICNMVNKLTENLPAVDRTWCGVQGVGCKLVCLQFADKSVQRFCCPSPRILLHPTSYTYTTQSSAHSPHSLTKVFGVSRVVHVRREHRVDACHLRRICAKQKLLSAVVAACVRIHMHPTHEPGSK